MIVIALADAGAMPPSTIARRIQRHKIGPADDRQLICNEMYGRDGRDSGIVEENAEQA